MLSLLLIIPRALAMLSIEFSSFQGFPITDLAGHPIFKIDVDVNGQHHHLVAINHQYESDVDMIEDPCLWGIEENGSQIGQFNLCKNIIEYQRKGRNFLIRKSPDGYTLESSLNSRLMNASDNSDTRKYRINVFVFNGSSRYSRLGKEIYSETKEIFKLADLIYKKSGADVEIALAGMLSLKSSLQKEKSMLMSFRGFVDPLRYNPKNIATSLSEADLVVFITESTSEWDNEESHQGMSYFGGANGLDKSYAVVYAVPGEPRYFTAKKLAHEIAHSLGVHHDSEPGFLMEATASNDSRNEDRLLSKKSLLEMNNFVTEYSDIFKKDSRLSKSFFLITSIRDANEFIKTRRKHDFNDIISKRNSGMIPDDVGTGYAISMVFILAFTLLLIVLIYKI